MHTINITLDQQFRFLTCTKLTFTIIKTNVAVGEASSYLKMILKNITEVIKQLKKIPSPLLRFKPGKFCNTVQHSTTLL